jgi:hypothetical protein
MKTSAYCNVHAQTLLEPHEGWKEHNDEGRPFKVRLLVYNGGDSVILRGWAIKVDGSQGYIERHKSKKLNELPLNLADGVRAAYRDALQQRLDEE